MLSLETSPNSVVEFWKPVSNGSWFLKSRIIEKKKQEESHRINAASESKDRARIEKGQTTVDSVSIQFQFRGRVWMKGKKAHKQKRVQILFTKATLGETRRMVE